MGFRRTNRCRPARTLGLLFDTRDNGINATRGWLASASYHTFFKGFVGGDATWQELSIDLRTYRPLTASGSHRLAFWVLSDLVTGGVAPYLDLPTTGGDARSGRGYTEGRYRGERLVYGEVEYRGTLMRSGLLGFVAFLNTSTIASTETGFDPLQQLRAGGRHRAARAAQQAVAHEPDERLGVGQAGVARLYLGIQEAF